jgi:hypothetical protein
MLTVLYCHICRDAAGDCVIYVVYHVALVSITDIFKQMALSRVFVPDGRDLQPGSPSEAARVADSGRLRRLRAGDRRLGG